MLSLFSSLDLLIKFVFSHREAPNQVFSPDTESDPSAQAATNTRTLLLSHIWFLMPDCVELTEIMEQLLWSSMRLVITVELKWSLIRWLDKYKGFYLQILWRCDSIDTESVSCSHGHSWHTICFKVCDTSDSTTKPLYKVVMSVMFPFVKQSLKAALMTDTLSLSDLQAKCTTLTTSPTPVSGNDQLEMAVASRIRLLCVFFFF